MEGEGNGRRRSITVTTKLQALSFLKSSNNVSKTARRFQVTRKQVREWRNNEEALKCIGNSNRSRLDGAGRKLLSNDLDAHLVEWITTKRNDRLRVSRSMIKREAETFMKQLQPETIFSSSNGWLQKFLRRNRFSLRRSTTVSQKQPSDCATKVVNFLRYTWKKIDNAKLPPSAVYAMDETPLWIEPCRGQTIDRIGKRDIPLKSTGHEKERITLILSAKADGTKLKPYVVIPRKRPIAELESMNGIEFVYADKSWMDDDLTQDYLNRIVGRFSFTRRLMVWDSFKSHISQRTKSHLRSMRIDSAVIPGGCTGLIQPADVSWNRSVKTHFQKSYDSWLTDRPHFFTSGGNMRPPSFPKIASWITDAWDSVPSSQIICSMKQCGIYVATDGSEDSEIVCFKPGHPCHSTINLLRCEENHICDKENVPGSSIDSDTLSVLSDSDVCDSDESN